MEPADRRGIVFAEVTDFLWSLFMLALTLFFFGSLLWFVAQWIYGLIAG